MPDPILITFARPEESRAFRRRHGFRLSGNELLKAEARGREAWLLHTGIGPEAAERAMRRAVNQIAASSVIAAGFAGGLDPALQLGDVIRESDHIISRPMPVESANAKAALWRETGARAVDMETQTIRQFCIKAGLPMTSARVISDTSLDDLPVPFPVWFDISAQEPRPFALVAHLLRHPRKIMPFARFVRSVPRLSERLALAIEDVL